MKRKEPRFLIDVGVGKKVEDWLLEEGYDIKTVRELNPRMNDGDILKIATSENRMVITMDKDFGELVYSSGQSQCGILLLRLEDANADEKVKIMKKILFEHQDRLLYNFCVFQHGKIRIRRQR